MPLVKVEDSSFVRDTQSRALINQDFAARDEYFAKVRMMNNNKGEINKLNAEVSDLKNELSDIKNLLQQLLLK